MLIFLSSATTVSTTTVQNIGFRKVMIAAKPGGLKQLDPLVQRWLLRSHRKPRVSCSPYVRRRLFASVQQRRGI